MYKWIDSLRSSDSDHITEFTFIWQNKFSPSKMLPAGGCNLTAWFMKHALQDVKTTWIRSSKNAGTSTGQTSKEKTNWPAVFAGKDCFFNNSLDPTWDGHMGGIYNIIYDGYTWIHIYYGYRFDVIIQKNGFQGLRTADVSPTTRLYTWSKAMVQCRHFRCLSLQGLQQNKNDGV